ncbi:MAG: helix-turn-helix transcriptional regulator [Desulfamplus sp.]|nr:helix-turn-helix transcriptional regulator [Desulfamplus sp.]
MLYEDNIDIEETEFWKTMQSNRLGNILAGSRIKANLTQKQLAEKLNISTKILSEYERGKRPFSPEIAENIAKILNIKIERLV